MVYSETDAGSSPDAGKGPMTRQRDLLFHTYEPDNVLVPGLWRVFPAIFRELVANRWLTAQLFRRDFLAMYKQSLFGFLWALVIPLVSVGTFIVLNRSGVFRISGLSLPYPVFAVMGVAHWQLFSTGLMGAANSLVRAGPMIMKINFSRKSLVIAAFAQSLVAFAVQWLLAMVLCAVYGVTPSAWIFLLPVLLLPLAWTPLGLGFVMASLNGIMRDVGNTLGVLLTFFMFLTPVLYPRPAGGLLAKITAVNPLYYMVSVPRELALTGHTSEWVGFWVSAAVGAVVFFICIYGFHLAETRVTERV